MKDYLKPVIVDEDIEIEDICYPSNIEDVGDVEERD